MLELIGAFIGKNFRKLNCTSYFRSSKTSYSFNKKLPRKCYKSTQASSHTSRYESLNPESGWIYIADLEREKLKQLFSDNVNSLSEP